jgi:hypothetical protein
LIVKLGKVAFDKDPDPKKVDLDAKDSWEPRECKAVEGCVYPQRVRDRTGNRYYVVFKVVALDPKSRYVAFLWRRLSGAKVGQKR